MEEIKYKHFAWSYDKQQLDEIIEELEKRQIACVCENNFGIYLLSVPQKYYQNALEIIREIGSEDQVGSINYYGRFRPLKAYSLAYAYLKDAKGLNKSWEDEFSRPQKIRKMVKQLRDICGCDIELIVNPNDSAIEIMTTKKISKTARIRDRVFNFLNNNNYVKFKETYICTPDGKIINPTSEEMLIIENIYRLFDTSFLACGIYQPKRANIVSMNNEEGYHSSKEYAGFIDDIKNIDEYSEDKIVITGEIKLFEDKRYNNAGEEISFLQNEFLSFKTRLVDNLDYSLTIILSDSMVAKITTKYKDYREVSSSRKLPFGSKNLGDKSSRDCFLPFPKINGEYEGIIEEYYMRSTDGTKLLHYATHSPYFCLFDIPTDFDFVNNNKALEETPSVYDIRDYNPEDPNLQNVRPMIDKAIKQLKLTGKN